MKIFSFREIYALHFLRLRAIPPPGFPLRRSGAIYSRTERESSLKAEAGILSPGHRSDIPG